MRKSKLPKKEALEAIARLEEIQATLKAAEQEDAEKMESAKNQINKLCEEGEYFCGVVLNAETIAKIVKMAIENKDDIRIPFNLYFND